MYFLKIYADIIAFYWLDFSWYILVYLYTSISLWPKILILLLFWGDKDPKTRFFFCTFIALSLI